MVRNKKNNEGAVLIIVLLILAGLSVIATQLSKYVFYDHALSSMSKITIRGKLLLESSENIATKLLLYNTKLMEENKEYYTIEELTTMYNAASSIFESEDISMEFFDENALFPLNTIVPFSDSGRQLAIEAQEILSRLIQIILRKNGFKGSDSSSQFIAEEMINAMLIWTGYNDLENEIQEAYLTDTVKRFPTKKLFNNPQELTLIHWNNIDEHIVKTVLYGGKQGKGLLDLVTVWSGGPMNINTLDPLIIEALCTEKEKSNSLAKQIVIARKNKGKIREEQWFREIFEENSSFVPSIQLVSDASKVFRLLTKIGNGTNQINMVSICIVFTSYVRWCYRYVK